MTRSTPRIALYAPHFGEYTVRLALALSERARVLLVVEGRKLRAECRDDLLALAREKLEMVEFQARGPWNKIRSLPWILARVLWFRPDVLHVQEQIDILSHHVVGTLGRFFPTLLTVHDPRPHSGTDTDYVVRNRAHRAVIRRTARAFHVHGAHCVRELRLDLGPDDHRSIRSTMHGVVLVPAPSERREPEPDRILMFGRMEAYKGLDTLLDAADELRRRGRRFRLVLAGVGPEIERLRDRIDGRDDVEATNRFLTPDEVVAALQRCCCLALPYKDATQSGVVAAAFGNGRPVVSSRIGGLVDVVRDGDNGLLIEPGDAMGLADRLDAILTDPALRDRLTAGARASAATDLDWHRIADVVFAAYADAGMRPPAAAA